MTAAVQTVGRAALGVIEEFGGVCLLLGRTFRAFPQLPRAFHLTVEQMYRVGVQSLPLVIVTSVFTGGVAAVQAAYQFQDYVPMRYLGTVIGKSVVIELGPVLTALVVAGRVSASIAAELGTMRVTEQVDALETMAIDPVRFLVLPRFVAAAVMLPVVTCFSDALAIVGGWVVATLHLHVSTGTFLEGLQLFFYTGDVIGGLIKAWVFGMAIAAMGCYFGMKTRGGAEGVGIATTKAVVWACLTILISDYVLASVLFSTVLGK